MNLPEASDGDAQTPAKNGNNTEANDIYADYRTWFTISLYVEPTIDVSLFLVLGVGTFISNC